ncbi:MAG: CCA tRNA nucleotidyltransferase [Segniliparus sp.]|uniref:CCA tRNA nucleotidyltransferase n=1 Tax=Segniliparus sp. TaxID=2804064 RepID=UPI003F2EB6FE
MSSDDLDQGAVRRARLLAQAHTALRVQDALFGALAARFVAAGHQLYLVGGSVRDAVLGRLGDDLDFTTDARPEQTQKLLRGWAEDMWDTGIAFGTVGALKDGHKLEITTFRTDSYDQRSRNPVVDFGTSLDVDLARRDFRMNAMAVSLTAQGCGEFVDPLGGLDDVLAGRIDTPDSPEISFGDDPLRMLRAARFAAQLGFTWAPRVVVAVEQMAGEIARITPERIGAELEKLLLGEHAVEGVEHLVDSGLAEHVLPEVPQLQLAIDTAHQHKDVYRHSLAVLGNAMALEPGDPDPVLRWAALLHDIGKPATRRFEKGGAVSFHHHEVVGAKLARKRLRALTFSKHMVEDIGKLVYLHMRFYGYGDQAWTDSAVRRYAVDAGELLPKLNLLVRADCTTRNQRRSRQLASAYDRFEQRIAKISEAEDLAKVRPDLDGNAIMEILGIGPGREVGEAWSFLKELRLEQGPLDPEDAERALLDWWSKR